MFDTMRRRKEGKKKNFELPQGNTPVAKMLKVMLVCEYSVISILQLLEEWHMELFEKSPDARRVIPWPLVDDDADGNTNEWSFRTLADKCKDEREQDDFVKKFLHRLLEALSADASKKGFIKSLIEIWEGMRDVALGIDLEENGTRLVGRFGGKLADMPVVYSLVCLVVTLPPIPFYRFLL